MFLPRLTAGFQEFGQVFGSLQELGLVASSPGESDDEPLEATQGLTVGCLGVLRSAQLLERGCPSKLRSCQIILVGVNGGEVGDEFLL